MGGESGTVRTVTGVVEDVINQVVTEAPKPFVYMPLWRSHRSSTTVVVRFAEGMLPVPATLRGAILEEDPSLSLSPVVALDRYTSIGILPQRVAAAITSVLACSRSC